MRHKAIHLLLVCLLAGCSTIRPNSDAIPAAEILFVEAPLTSGYGRTKILFSVKNNTREQVEGYRAVLSVYDQHEVRIFKSSEILDIVNYWWRAPLFGLFAEDGVTIEEWSGVLKRKDDSHRLFLHFDGADYFESEEFKNRFGIAKYFVIHLYKRNILVDVMSTPSDFPQITAMRERLRVGSDQDMH